MTKTKKGVNIQINKELRNEFKQKCLKNRTTMSSIANTLIEQCVHEAEKEIKEFLNSNKYYDLKQPVEIVNDAVVLYVSCNQDVRYHFKVFCALKNKTQSYMLSLLIQNYLEKNEYE